MPFWTYKEHESESANQWEPDHGEDCNQAANHGMPGFYIKGFDEAHDDEPEE